jgi:hypothetical protein
LYEFYRVLHDAVQKFPKSEKYSLGQALQNTTLILLRSIIIATRSDKITRKGTLSASNADLDILKLLIRLALDTKSLDQKKYLLLETMLQEIGRMLGGWLRSLGN